MASSSTSEPISEHVLNLPPSTPPCQCGCEPPNLIEWYCDKCGPDQRFTCSECYTHFHARGPTRAHPKLSAPAFWALFSEQSFIPQEADHQADKSNVFCEFFVINQSLKLGPKFLAYNDVPETEWLPCVGFIGPSGVGKSRIMRSLCVGPKPLPADPQQTISTSGDINAYRGCFENQNTILFDCEGTGGVDVPISKLFQLQSIEEGLRKLFYKAGTKLLKDDIIEKRRNLVEIAYPRLMYLFNDVLVYIFKQQRERETIISRLINYAQAASIHSTNTIKPSLVIVFNMVPFEEGKWDPLHANTWLRDEDRARLNPYFLDIQILYFPDINHSAEVFIQQLGHLTNAINLGLNRSRRVKVANGFLLQRSQLFNLFQTAVTMFSEDPSAHLDFFELSTRLNRGNAAFTDDLEAYFLAAFAKARKGDGHHQPLSPSEAWQFALNNLTQRFIDVVLWSAHVNHVPGLRPGPDSSIPDFWIKRFLITYESIRKLLPCQARHTFLQYDGTIIDAHCTEVLAYHSETHKSSLSFKAKRDEFSAWSLVFKNYTPTPCHWPGEFQNQNLASYPLSTMAPPFAILDHAWKHQPHLEWPITQPEDRASFYEQHKQAVKDSSHHIRAVYSEESDLICLGCLLELPTLLQPCGHLFCRSCVLSGFEFDDRKCPICDHEMLSPPTQLPIISGPRILTLDGGGVRGLVEVIILQRLEEIIGVPIQDCFDLIGGTSTGALVAAALFAKTSTISTLSALRQAFQDLPKRVFGQPSLLSYFKGYTYERQPLHELICDIIGGDGVPMLSCTDRAYIFTTTCAIEDAQLATVLFASYNRSRTLDDSGDSSSLLPRIQAGSLSAALEASSAAPTFFPLFHHHGKVYTDGGLQQNNPILVAIREAKALFPNQPISYLLSVGTGTRGREQQASKQLEEGRLAFLRIALQGITDTEGPFRQAAGLLGDSVHRCNPSLEKLYALDEINDQVLQEMMSATEADIAKSTHLFELIASRIVISSLYLSIIDPPYDGRDEIFSHKSEIKVQIRSRFPLPQKWSALFLGQSPTLFLEHNREHFYNHLEPVNPPDNTDLCLLFTGVIDFLMPHTFKLDIRFAASCSNGVKFSISGFPRTFNISPPVGSSSV